MRGGVGMLAGLLASCAIGLASCSSTPSVSGTCDTEALHHEIAHLVAESGFTVASVDVFTCAGDWAYVEATLDEPGRGEVADHFLLRHDGEIWVLKAPESACVDDAIPEPVHTAACAGPA